MEKLSVNEILKAVSGSLISKGGQTEVSEISTDSRTIKPGDLFISLVGDKYDAHDYLDEVFLKGCSTAVVSKKNIKIPDGVNIIYVEDTLKALGSIAAYYRMKLNMKVVGITGSNGKTTTKEILGQLLSFNRKIAITEGTKNNLVGLPQTLFSADKTHEFVVVELGINHFGEMERLSFIAKPDVAVITNIGPSHLEFLGNEDGVCRAKSEIFMNMNKNSIVVLNKNDRYFDKLRANASCGVVSCAIDKKADYEAKNLRKIDNGIQFDLIVNGGFMGNIFFPMFGEHNVLNLLCALAACEKIGVPFSVVAGVIPTLSPPKMRMQVFKIDGITVINDAYNANPASTSAALLELARIKSEGKKIFVFADMLELGEKSEHYHREVGAIIKTNNCVDVVAAIGQMAKYAVDEINSNSAVITKYFDTADGVLQYIKPFLIKDSVVLFKGSRGNKLEKIVEELILGKQ